ncbi:hypothetical protein BKH46_06020 [Helicobacter sp. 12S02634-8]|uniref:outer membrane family protein n=1 Tax=Helicobacter sp. 12S02634-8 TaxID=1476199 RepID=UPI000BA66E41|nr:outer membrane family protein [Helicobacter sp. 12S02634-8]PAF46775.1 hypothetical protein BKH46_06020 [Helicobacter sp. 12S02634-8]
MKTLGKTLLAVGIFTSLGNGFEYKVNGQVQNYSKFGFNNDKINQAKGKYPTDSFSTMIASLGVNMDIGAGFQAGLGGTIGGIVYDGTKYQKTIDNTTLNPDGLVWNYFGFWAGNDYRFSASANNTKNYFIQNAFITYTYDKYIQIKGGRFQMPGDWFSGYIQGLYLQSWAIPHTRLWSFATNHRASWGGKWFKDYKYINPNVAKDNGKGFYVFGVGAEFKYKNFSAQPYFYAQDSRFYAPGIHLTYDTNPDFKSEGFRSKTEIIFLHMTHVGPALQKSTAYNNYDALLYPGQQFVGRGGESLLLKQTFEIDRYYFGGAFYKNFGNPNEFLAPYGDPTGFDNYDNSVYDSAAWNNVFRRDAINGFLFAGAQYAQLKITLLGRYTDTPRAREEAFSIGLDYKFAHNILAGLKAEYYNNTTFKGFTLGYSGNKPKPLTQNVTQDRSYISTFIQHNF